MNVIDKSYETILSGQRLQEACHSAAVNSGWWTDLSTGLDTRWVGGIPNTGMFNVPEKLMLIVSEVAEAMEGHRKHLQDDKLPHRSMLEAELADAVIRCFDLAGGCGFDLGLTIVEKLAYNAQRADHKLANRKLVGGKKF